MFQPAPRPIPGESRHPVRPDAPDGRANAAVLTPLTNGRLGEENSCLNEEDALQRWLDLNA